MTAAPSTARIDERLFDDATAMEAALASDLAERIGACLATTGTASLVASGGSSPAAVYGRLSGAPIAWERVTVTPSDERWVGVDDPASNAGMISARLLRGPAAAARFVGLTTADAGPSEAEREVDARIVALAAPFAAVLLGMGSDGHTASLFPGAPQLDAALDLDATARVRAIGPVAEAVGAAWRMTLTLRALTDTASVVLLIRGADKLEVYKAARAAASAGGAPPVAALFRQSRAPVTVYWAP